MEPNLVQKLDYEVLEFEKKRDKINIKVFKFWKNSTQTPTRKPPHKFFNVKIILEDLSKREELHYINMNITM
jgi:hypothetical protein